MKPSCIALFLLTLCSCAGAKYSLSYDVGKQLDFSEGRWLLNGVETNSHVFRSKLYDVALVEFKNILGDSLLELNEVRATKLVPLHLNPNMSVSELQGLKTSTDCDYLIFLSGNVISDGAGSLAFPDQDNFSSNRASVALTIYDLQTGVLLSSSQVYGKTHTQAASFNPDDKIPSILPSSHMIMLKGTKKLIRSYNRNRLEN